MVSLSTTLFMLPRELPNYLKVAYTLRYEHEPNEGNRIARICHSVQRVFALVKEIIRYRPSFLDFHFSQNSKKLEKDFEKIGGSLGESKPICVYFVSKYDNSGAILGDTLYYYHHYKIQTLQKHFAVAPKLVATQQEMKDFMQKVKRAHPGREIKFVDIVAHGSKSCVYIRAPGPSSLPETEFVTAENLQANLFEDTSADATILLDACMTGLGCRNIADEIARKTPGRTVLAPGPSMCFSKPVIRLENHAPKVVSAAHGFALFNAYTCKSFSYTHREESRFPYVKFENFKKDILLIAEFPEIQNAWLDSYLDESDEVLKQKALALYDKLSPETRELVAKEVWKKQGVLEGNAKDQGEAFLRASPLNADVRAAFRVVFVELVHEVRDLPIVSLARKVLVLKNIKQVIGAWFRNLSRKSVAAVTSLSNLSTFSRKVGHFHPVPNPVAANPPIA